MALTAGGALALPDDDGADPTLALPPDLQIFARGGAAAPTKAAEEQPISTGNAVDDEKINGWINGKYQYDPAKAAAAAVAPPPPPPGTVSGVVGPAAGGSETPPPPLGAGYDPDNFDPSTGQLKPEHLAKVMAALPSGGAGSAPATPAAAVAATPATPATEQGRRPPEGAKPIATLAQAYQALRIAQSSMDPTLVANAQAQIDAIRSGGEVWDTGGGRSEVFPVPGTKPLETIVTPQGTAVPGPGTLQAAAAHGQAENPQFTRQFAPDLRAEFMAPTQRLPDEPVPQLKIDANGNPNYPIVGNDNIKEQAPQREAANTVLNNEQKLQTLIGQFRNFYNQVTQAGGTGRGGEFLQEARRLGSQIAQWTGEPAPQFDNTTGAVQAMTYVGQQLVSAASREINAREFGAGQIMIAKAKPSLEMSPQGVRNIGAIVDAMTQQAYDRVAYYNDYYSGPGKFKTDAAQQFAKLYPTDAYSVMLEPSRDPADKGAYASAATINRLRDDPTNPNLIARFNQKFGDGAAQKVLQSRIATNPAPAPMLPAGAQ